MSKTDKVSNVGSPYLRNSRRLAEVVAAIQVMSASAFHMKRFSEWAIAIVGNAESADNWETIFREHPEFFRIDSTGAYASLVWRRQFPKDFHVDKGRRLEATELKGIVGSELSRLSRAPLSPDDVKALMEIAISIQAQALALKQEARWIRTVVAGATGGVAATALAKIIELF